MRGNLPLSYTCMVLTKLPYREKRKRRQEEKERNARRYSVLWWKKHPQI